MNVQANYVRCSWCKQVYPAIPNQLGLFSEYETFMCIHCIQKVQLQNRISFQLGVQRKTYQALLGYEGVTQLIVNNTHQRRKEKFLRIIKKELGIDKD